VSARSAPRARTSGGIVVVGGGPAGLAVAIQARLADLPVTVLDRARPPIDKPCGEGLMPDGVSRLEALGVELPPTARPFRGICYQDEQTVAEGRFPAAETAPGLGIRRTELHAAMVRRAEALGVELCWGERVERVLEGEEITDPDGAPVGVATAAGRVVLGRWLVGADGLLSRVRRHVAGTSAAARRRPAAADGAARRFGVRRHLLLAPWTDLVEVHWAEGAEAYVTPVGPETVGIAILWNPGAPSGPAGPAGFDDLLARFARLADRVAGAQAVSRDLGCGPLAQRVPAVARGRIALVGDAGGYLDAITGEGLSLAFHQAEALVGALVACERTGAADLRRYHRAHRRIRRVPEGLIRLLLFVERRPALRRRVLRALAAEPALFDRLLGVHARALRLRDLVTGGDSSAFESVADLLRFTGHLARPRRPDAPRRSRPTAR